MNLLKAFVALIAISALTACGGGSSSSGSGNSGGGSQTLVVNSSPSLAMLRSPHLQPTESRHIAAFIADLLMRNAWATELAGSEVIVFDPNGVPIDPTTSDADMLFYVVPPGDYTVCVYPLPVIDPPEPTDDECEQTPVRFDQVVVVTAVPDNGGFDLVVNVDNREDQIDIFQNPNRPNQSYVCHKGKTRSPATQAAIRGHQVHGDSLGPCDGQNGNNNGNNNGNGGPTRVTVCHNGKTTSVPEPALSAHLGHGDSEGACG